MAENPSKPGKDDAGRFVAGALHPNFVDHLGKRYGRLLAVEHLGSRPYGSKGRLSFWRCVCDCGEEIEIAGRALSSGTRSCGCYARQSAKERATRHGHAAGGTRSLSYRSWQSALARCTRTSNPNFAIYGGRGIRMCERWLDFHAFVEDMGKRPSIAHTLDRINPDGNYEPGNCRWATKSQQQRNRRDNRVVTYQGQRMSLADAAELAGVNFHTAKSRLDRGWSDDEALSTNGSADAAI